MTTVVIEIDADFGRDSNILFPGSADMLSVTASASGTGGTMSMTRVGFGPEIINVSGNSMTATQFDVAGNFKSVRAFQFGELMAHMTIIPDGAWATSYDGISIGSLASMTIDSLVSRIKLLTLVNLILIGNAGNDTLQGSNYSGDVLIGKAGADTLNGGGGTDTASYAGAFSGVTLNLATGTGTLGDASGDRFVSIENVTGSDFGDTITGDSKFNVLDGLLGFDVIRGGEGNDTVVGGDGGGQLFGDGGDDRIDGGAENDTLRGGAGEDQLRTIFGDNNHAYGEDGNDTLIGARGGNHFFGGAGNDTIESFRGTDTLDGGTGADRMSSGDGVQLFMVDNSADVVSDSILGDDDRVLASVSYSLGPDSRIERLTTTNNAGTAAINLTGDQNGQQLVGNAAANVLDGNGGADLLVGLGGGDTYRIDNAGDIVDESVSGSGGTDTVTSAFVSINMAANNLFKGDIERATLLGNATLNVTGNNLGNAITGNIGTNLLDGRTGNDSINASDGSDRLIGSLGADTLNGGSGADFFDYNAVNESGLDAATRDRIAGFLVNGDRIDLASIDAISGGADNPFAFRGTAAFNAVGQVRLQQSGADTIVEVNTVGTGGAEMTILLAGITATTLDAGEFIL